MPEARPEIVVPGARATRKGSGNHELGGFARRYTVEETRHQLDTVEGMMTVGAGHDRIVTSIRRPPPHGLGVSKYRAIRLIDRVKERWRREDEETGRRSEWRSAAIRRITTQIQNCQGKRARDPETGASGGWIERPDHRALARYESLLADIQGTREPIQVEASIEYTETLVSVFAGYTVDELREMRDRAERAHRLADAYRRERPELAAAIDVEGSAAE